MAAHEDLSIVLVQSALVVADGGHVLDDDAVVRVLLGAGLGVLLIEDVVGGDHVIDNVALADLLAAELLRRGEVLAVVVAEVVVRGDGGQLNAGADQEVDKGGLHLCLAGLEVVTADESGVLRSELNAARDEGVLRGTVNERRILEDRSDGEDSRGGNLFVARFDRSHEILGSVVDAGNE